MIPATVRTLLAIIMAAMPGSTFYVDDPQIIEAQSLPQIALRVHQNVNAARQAARLAPLTWNEALGGEAERHARSLAAKLSFSHKDEIGDLPVRLQHAGIFWRRCAENLYREKGFGEPSRRAVTAWLHSPGHRGNILDSGLTETGVGAALQRDGTLIIVQEFLAR